MLKPEKLTDEQIELCRCKTCPTYTINKLSGDPFCTHGTTKKAKALKLHNGCDCQSCEARRNVQFNVPIFDGVMFCMLEDGKHYPGAFEEHDDIGEESKDAPKKVEITTTPAGADAGAIKLDTPKKE